MNKRYIQILSGLLFVLLMTQSGISGENKKLAQTGFQFLSVVSDAHASAMAEAMTSLQIGSSALFFNPAGMANMEGLIDISASNWVELARESGCDAFLASPSTLLVVDTSTSAISSVATCVRSLPRPKKSTTG